MSTTTDCCTNTPARPVETAQRHTEIFHPQCDAFETDDGLTIVADMPGAAADSIDITFERGVLTLRARVSARRPEDLTDDATLLNEYGVGDYYRTFRVGVPINPDGITASYSEGVLTLKLPRHESARQRRIRVTAQ